MQHIDSEQEYDSIVRDIVEEYDEAIGDGRAREIANGAVATFDRMEHDHTAIVTTAGEVYGESIDAIDGTALDSYDVIAYSEADANPIDLDQYRDPAASLAAMLLAQDIVTAFQIAKVDGRSDERDRKVGEHDRRVDEAHDDSAFDDPTDP